MSLFSSEIDKEIKASLDARQGSKGKRDVWYYQKTPWVMLVSNAALADSTGTGFEQESRKKNVLYLGTTDYLTSSTFDIKNVDRFRSPSSVKSIGGTIDYKNRLAPGITSVSITAKDSKNTIKEATINFNVWTLDDLNIYERLYMTPGQTLRLEWGWSTAILDSQTTPTPLDPTKVYDPVKYYNDANQRKKDTGGHWGGIMGKVVNFEWQLNENGGFDCMTKIITIGDMLMSTSLERSTGFQSNSSKKDRDETAATPLTNIKSMIATAKREIEKGKIWRQGKTLGLIGSGKYCGVGVAASGEKTGTGGEETEYTADDGWFDDGHLQYVTWAWIEDYLITGNLGFHSEKKKYPSNYSLPDSRLINTTVKHKDIWPKLYSGRIKYGSLEVSPSVCRNSKFLKSADPWICVLPGFTLTSLEKAIRVLNRQDWIGRLFYDPPATPSTNLNQALTTDNTVPPLSVESFATDDNFNQGYIRNILVNVRWLEEILDQNKTVEGFLKQALDGISESCGNLWNFEVVGDENFPEILKVVDTTYITDKANTKDPYLLKVYNVDSMVRNVTMTSKISERMKGSIMAGQVRANQENKKRGNVTTDNEGESIAFFGAPVRDLTDYGSYQTQPKDIGASTTDEDQKKVKEEGDMLGELAKAYENVGNERTDETVDRVKSALKELFNNVDRGSDGTKHAGWRKSLIIPFSLNIDIDGIEGLRFGNKITIDYKPERYLKVKGNNVKDEIYFQVKKVSHQIDTSGWKTTLETHPIVVPET